MAIHKTKTLESTCVDCGSPRHCFAVSHNDGDGAVCVLFMDCHTIATALARNDRKDFTTRIHFLNPAACDSLV